MISLVNDATYGIEIWLKLITILLIFPEYSEKMN